jgi:hypothetical protein
MWMAPLLLSALVGIGVKIASDVVVAGAKRIFKFGGSETPFASTLDQARGAAPAAPAAAGAPRALDPAASDRSRVLGDAVVAPPAASRALGVAAYQRLDDIPQQTV